MVEITELPENEGSIRNIVDDEDAEDDSWIPLSETPSIITTSSSSDPNDTVPPSNRQEPRSSAPPPSTSNTQSSSTNNNKAPHQQQRERLQRRLETRISLKSNLVDHPIDLFWKRYLWNLALEVWALEWHIRLGLCMVVSGIALKIFLLSTWYFWYPRFVLLMVLMLAATIYLDPFGFQQQWDAIGKVLSNPENILLLVQRLDSCGLRRLTVVLLLVPTLLEMRTLSFLSSIKAETGWTLYNMLLSCTLLGCMMYWFNMKNVKPRECLFRGLLILYGSALWVTIYKTNLSRMPILAAPFLTATGTILITYQDDDMEWISRVLRHALRLALRDVLSSMGTKVSQDEMLQLAILRWLADYWASAPMEASSSSTPSGTTSNQQVPHTSRPSQPARSESSASASDSDRGPASHQAGSVPSSSSSSNTGSARPTQRRSASAILQRRHDVTWDELLPMLNIATDHMTSEVRMLQSNSQATGSVPPQPNTSNSNSNRPSTTPATEPMDTFHSMLSSWNVDERAEPAVRAYKHGVESFPPNQRVAILLSALRRCPALLTILLHIIMVKPGILSSTIVLAPFVLLEYHRIVAWIRCCEQVQAVFQTAESEAPGTTENVNSFIPEALRGVDPMVILLVGDSYDPSRPPALLLVWKNVLNSVSALEVGLTAARCAETTAVAVQFAGNVMSLVQFGHEIHQHGILHGLLVMGKEAILMHALDESMRGREATKYTNAAMGAVESAQRVARNVQTLAQDDKIGHVIQPVVWAACALSGYGWLWGKEEPLNDEPPEAATNNDASTPPADSSPEVSHESPPDGQERSGTTAKENPIPSKDLDQLSDLMDEVVACYGDGGITVAQKDELCEKLTHVSGSNDSAAVDEIRKSLADFRKKNQERKEESKERVPSSAVMEMVLAAYYRGFIDQMEKAAFCQRIASLSDEDRTNPDIVGGMMRTLSAILEHGEAIGRSTSNVNQGDEHKATEGSTSPGADQETRSSSIPVATATASIPPAQIVEENATVDSGQARHAPAASGADTNTTSGQDRLPDGNPHEGLVRLGMATLSMVVGGILLSRNHENQEEEVRQQEQRSSSESNETGEHVSNNGSSVVIEEVPDETDDEWITVAQ